MRMGFRWAWRQVICCWYGEEEEAAQRWDRYGTSAPPDPIFVFQIPTFPSTPDITGPYRTHQITPDPIRSHRILPDPTAGPHLQVPRLILAGSGIDYHLPNREAMASTTTCQIRKLWHRLPPAKLRGYGIDYHLPHTHAKIRVDKSRPTAIGGGIAKWDRQVGSPSGIAKWDRQVGSPSGIAKRDRQVGSPSGIQRDPAGSRDQISRHLHEHSPPAHPALLAAILSRQIHQQPLRPLCRLGPMATRCRTSPLPLHLVAQRQLARHEVNEAVEPIS